MPTIGFDISQLAHPGGVANYTARLASGLNQIEEFKMIYFYSSLRQSFQKINSEYFERQYKLKKVRTFKLPPSLFEILFNKVRNVPIEKFMGPMDLFHSSDWIQPPSRAKKITTFHDVVPLIHPEWSTPKIVEVHKRRLKLVESEIDMVIAVSEATKRDLIKISSIPEEKIQVIYEGVEAKFKTYPEEEVNNFKRKYKLPQNFVLAVGGVGERRNLKRAKEACKDIPLVISGETIPWVKNEELPLLYNSAQVLLYPSFYEGFGLPVLEAMSCGVPVVISNTSSLPEIGGDAAQYVNPEDVSDIQKKLKQVLEDKDLRSEMIEKGLKQAKKFSWEKCVKETADLYKKVLES